MRHTRLILLILSAAAAFPALAAETLDGVAAIVGDSVILRSDLDLAATMMASRMEQQLGPLGPDQYREIRLEALRSLIDDRLIMDVAERNEVAATDEDIDAAIASIAAEEGVSADVVYASARAQGLDPDTYREQLGMQLTRMRVVHGSVRSRIAVTEAQVRELYEQRYAQVKPGERIRVLHILLPIPFEATPEQMEQMIGAATQIREQALDSGDFATLARRYSAAPTAAEGGLTVFRGGDAPPEIEAALRQLVPGEITPLIRTAHGLNIFQFLDRFDPSQVGFEDVSEQLRAELVERETLPEFDRWLNEMREGQYIEIVNPAPR
jgi:peptidyl-prolyl cis-trans isomerase SurA